MCKQKVFPEPGSCDCRRAGLVLPAVLMLLALTAALTLHAQLTARIRLRQARGATERARLRILASDAAWQALLDLTQENLLLLTHTNADWALPRDYILPDGVAVRAGMSDATRRFNVNNLGCDYGETEGRPPEDVMSGLLQAAGSRTPEDDAARLRAGLVQAMQESDEAMLQGSGALLDLLPELPPERLEVLLTALPVALRHPLPVNVNTATPEVLQALLGDARRMAADALIARRDAQPLAALEHFAGYGDLGEYNAYLAVGSAFFEVWAEAEDQGVIAKVWALAELNAESGLRVHRWVCR
ncbi:MAG: general secretion pathway protein GspK [Lentisphaerae bacterium]|nr:general secretion pathway protein GspK [Lentisphaerota bacterium]